MTEIAKLLGAADASTTVKQDVLERAGLLSRDPSAYPNLSIKLDPDVGLDAAFKPVAYDTRNTTGEMVPCSICQQHQKHYDGAIVRLKDGRVGLVGNECGKRHFFGEDGWTAITNRWKQESERALFVARFGTAKEQFRLIDGLIKDWSKKVGTINRVRSSFKRHAPKLFAGVRRHSDGGALSKIEEYEVPFRSQNGEIERRTEFRQVLVCTINAEWFFNDVDFQGTLEELRVKLANAVKLLKADATSQNVTAVKRMLRDSRQGLETCAHQLGRIAPLRDPTALNRLVLWADQSLRGKETYRLIQPLSLEVQSRHETVLVDLSELPDTPTVEWAQINEMWPAL